MVKKRVLVVLIVFSLLIVSGCGQKNKEAQLNQANSTSDEVYKIPAAVDDVPSDDSSADNSLTEDSDYQDAEYEADEGLSDDEYDEEEGLVENTETSEEETVSAGYFHYQLTDSNYEKLKLAADKNYFIVIDVDDFRDNNEGKSVSDLKFSADGERIVVLSYLSIGEAEDYRTYWKKTWTNDGTTAGKLTSSAPSWLDNVNTEWGSRKVKYWSKSWQEDVVLNRVDDIANQGYDGVYLDVVDAYYYFQEEREPKLTGNIDYEQEMINLVGKIKERQPNLLVFPQNALELYESNKTYNGKLYKDIIQGIGKESTWYVGDEVNDAGSTAYELAILKKARADGKAVLAIDYPEDDKKICDFYEKCSANGFMCTVSNKNLDLNEAIMPACS